MHNLVTIARNSLPMMTDDAIDKVRVFENCALQFPQVDIRTAHTFHAGIYARTIMIPAGTVLTGALIKIATVLIVSGDVTVYIGDETIDLYGYHVLSASAHRKQAFVAHTDTYLTMVFSTKATTVEEAEEEFTDEAHKLISRKDT